MRRPWMIAVALCGTGVSCIVQVAAQDASQAAAQHAAQAVRKVRQASNQAIAERGMEAYVATITADFVITSGSGRASTRSEFLELWAKQFADPNWGGCVRTTGSIEMSATQPAAAEHGTFTCSSTQSDGTQIYTGTYLAMWRNDDGRGWRTRSEMYVTLGCAGSAACGTAPRAR